MRPRGVRNSDLYERRHRLAGGLLDDQAEQEVVGVGVEVALARRELVAGLADLGEHLVGRPDAGRVGEDGGGHSRNREDVHHSARMVEQLADRDLVRVVERGDVLGQWIVEADRPAQCQPADERRDEGLADAPEREERVGGHRRLRSQHGFARLAGPDAAVRESDCHRKAGKELGWSGGSRPSSEATPTGSPSAGRVARSAPGTADVGTG